MKRLLLLLFVTISFYSYSQDNKYLPVGTGEIVTHQNYILSYVEKHEQAEWVAYELTASETNKVVERSDKFKPDPSVSTGSATLQDYKGSGYDRGHLAPAADMGFNSTAMNESFYMSNMSPQLPGFNRGIWKNLESLVRSYAQTYGKIYIVTGPVLVGKANTIGNNVTVPDRYYKIILREDGPNVKMIAFLLTNGKHSEPLSKFVVNTDIIESISGIDFFPQLPNDLEKELEQKVDTENWYFDSSKPIPPSTKSVSTSTSEQCKGIAKSTGVRCKNMTKNENGYCHLHQSQTPEYKKAPVKSSYSVRCCATTKAGTRCKRKASSGSKYCWQHQNN